MCSEIQICAEQRWLSSSTSNAAFAGTLYRERTNTSIFIASSKLSLTSTNFIQNLFTSHQTVNTDFAQRHTFNLWSKLYVAHNFLLKLSYMHIHRRHTCVKTSGNLLLLSVIRSNLRFEILSCALFPLSAPTSKYQTHQDFTQSETNIFNSSQFRNPSVRDTISLWSWGEGAQKIKQMLVNLYSSKNRPCFSKPQNLCMASPLLPQQTYIFLYTSRPIFQETQLWS